MNISIISPSASKEKLKKFLQVEDNVVNSFYESATFRNILNSPTSCNSYIFKISLGLDLSGLFVSSLIQTPQTHVWTFPIVSKNQRNMLTNYSDFNRQMLRCIAKSELCLLAAETGTEVLLPYFEPVKQPMGLVVAFPVNFQKKEVSCAN